MDRTYLREAARRPAVGLGFRAEFASHLVARPEVVDFVEVVAETCFTQRVTRREACALAEMWPVVPHGVKLSLGSADGVDLDRARRLGALARQLRASVISEHVSFTRAGEVDIGHLTQLPRTREAIAVVANNVARVRRVLPDVPLLLENVAWSFRWPDDEMDEATFYHEIVEATGCELLLDLGNLYANAINEGLDPHAVLAGYPLDRVGMVHVAGGVREHGFYFDTHAHGIPEGVLALAREVVARRDVPVLIERDANFDFAEVAAELAWLRALPRAAPRVHEQDRVETGPLPPRSPVDRTRGAGNTLAAAQRELAGQLVGGEPVTPLGARIGSVALDRSRGILQRKRIDDALPLVANLARCGGRVREVAAAALAQSSRPASGAGPADAWRIAEAAMSVPELVSAAAIDRLVLRARFAGTAEGTPRPRRTPFIGVARLSDGRRIRATKGIGARADVSIHEQR
jgi:uncharacterized protein